LHHTSNFLCGAACIYVLGVVLLALQTEVNYIARLSDAWSAYKYQDIGQIFFWSGVGHHCEISGRWEKNVQRKKFMEDFDSEE